MLAQLWKKRIISSYMMRTTRINDPFLCAIIIVVGSFNYIIIPLLIYFYSKALHPFELLVSIISLEKFAFEILTLQVFLICPILPHLALFICKVSTSSFFTIGSFFIVPTLRGYDFFLFLFFEKRVAYGSKLFAICFASASNSSTEGCFFNLKWR